MRIYFLSQEPAGLRLDGVYAGVIDGFGKFFETDKERVLCEVIPGSALKPLHFFIDDGFFSCPPDFADVYLTDGDAVVNICRYTSCDGGVFVVAQARYCGNLATLILNGGRPCLVVEGKCALQYPLPREFSSATMKEGQIGGRGALFIEGEGCLAVISESGKQVFVNPVESWETGEKLRVRVPYATCAKIVADCTFCYDGESMRPESSTAKEYAPPDEDIIHFAFFESVLHRAGFAKYLGEELKPKADALPSFLGEFTEVTVPPEKFYLAHPSLRSPETRVAGLCYPLKSNLFSIKYFAVRLSGGLIENIYEVE